MSKPISFIEASKLLRSPEHTQITAESTDVADFGRDIQAAEMCIALRFECGIDGFGMPRMTNFSDTFTMLRRPYDKTCTSSPNLLRVDYDVDDELLAVYAALCLPLAAMGRQNKAVTAELTYSIRETREQGKTIRKLGREATKTAAVRDNPFFQPKVPGESSVGSNSNRSTMASKRFHGIPLHAIRY